MITEKKILKTGEAAKWLGISVREFKRLVDGGFIRRLRGYRKPFKFSVFELDRFLREGCVASSEV